MGLRIGYIPTPDHLRSIVDAAQDGLSALRKWSPCFCGLGDGCTCCNDTSLPNFPHDIGNAIIIEKFHVLERLINPHAFPLHHPSRRRIEITSWPSEVELGLSWLVAHVGRLLEEWGLGWLSVAGSLEDDLPGDESWTLDSCLPLVVFRGGMRVMGRIVEMLETELRKLEQQFRHADDNIEGMFAMPGEPTDLRGRDPDRGTAGPDQFAIEGPGQVSLPLLGPCDEMPLSALEAKKRLEAIAHASRTFVDTARRDPIIEGRAGHDGARAPSRYLVSRQTLRSVAAVKRLLLLPDDCCGMHPTLEAASSVLDARSLAGLTHVCEFWLDWKDERRSEQEDGTRQAADEAASLPFTFDVDEVSALNRQLEALESTSTSIGIFLPRAGGDQPSASPARQGEGELTISHPAPAKSPKTRAAGRRGAGLSVVHRALSVALDMVKDGKPLNVAEIARVVRLGFRTSSDSR